MIFVVDTSSAVAAIALLTESGRVEAEALHASGRSFDLPAAYRALDAGTRLTRVAVATGPGSFTGLRVGVSFGLGLAIGLRIPIVPLRSLELQAARAASEATAVVEAGRGRLYYQAPGEGPALAAPAEVPARWPVVGWLRPATEEALIATGHEMVPTSEQRTFGAAAAQLVRSASEAPYGSVKIFYMQSFSPPA